MRRALGAVNGERGLTHLANLEFACFLDVGVGIVGGGKETRECLEVHRCAKDSLQRGRQSLWTRGNTRVASGHHLIASAPSTLRGIQQVSPRPEQHIRHQPHHNAQLRLASKTRLGSTRTARVATYGKITFSVGWTSLPSSQNAAGLASRRKNRGKMGKKNPMTMPRRIILCADVCTSGAFPALSMESIHCSSNARACSSSTGINQAPPTQHEMHIQSSSFSMSMSR